MRGYVDLHTHGIGKYDTRTTSPADILKIATLHRKAGTDAICLAVYPGPIDVMKQQVDVVRRAIEKQKHDSGFRQTTGQGPVSQAMILGVHLEGPFLNARYCGALDKKTFVKPSLALLKKLIKSSSHSVH